MKPRLLVGSLIAISALFTQCGDGDEHFVSRALMADSLHLNQLRPTAARDAGPSEPVRLIGLLYPGSIDTVYVDPERNRVEAFNFRFDSPMSGIADVRYRGDTLVSIDLYNRFDARLSRIFVPSCRILVFHDNQANYVFDCFGEKLLRAGRDSLRPLVRGIPAF